MAEPEQTPVEVEVTPEEQGSSTERVVPTVRSANGPSIILNIEAAISDDR